MRTLATIALLLLAACGADDKRRHLCYLQVDYELAKKAETMCPPSAGEWEECEHHKQIEDEHKQALSRCPQ